MQFHKEGRIIDLSPDQTHERPATADDWKILPMAGHHKTISLSLEFTGDQFRQITSGHIPQEMEDKWFIYWDGEFLNFHRSWTGHCIYRLKIRQEGDIYCGRELRIVTDESIMAATSEEREVEMLLFIVGAVLLDDEAMRLSFIERFKQTHPPELWGGFGNLLF